MGRPNLVDILLPPMKRCGFDVSFDEFAFGEGGSDEGHYVGCVDGEPSGALGDALAQADGREGRLDLVRGPQVDPVLGGLVVEREDRVNVVGHLCGGFGPLGPLGLREPFHGCQRAVLVLGLRDLRMRHLRTGCADAGRRPRTRAHHHRSRGPVRASPGACSF